jgi:hypothetical protein
MEDINKFLRANKILLSAMTVLLFTVFWNHTYYPRHQGEDTPARELALVYALNDLKEIQNAPIVSIEEIDVLGGDRKLKIKVRGDMNAAFTEEMLMRAGWYDVRREKDIIQGKRTDCFVQVSQGWGSYEILISPLF